MATRGAGRARTIAPVALLGVVLAGCASAPPPGSYGVGQGTYRVGRPYEIRGVWYYPTVDYNYERTGIASWYGGQFEGRLTANGEIFDLNQLTAAHTTLPMPSIVLVTNLENGRSLQLRVNDRGPFVDGRLIDVTRRAAQLLGFENKGTTRVRVTVLKDESIAAADAARHGTGQFLVADSAGSTGAASTGVNSNAANSNAANSNAAPATVPVAAPSVAAALAYSRPRPAPARAPPLAYSPPRPPLPQVAMAPREAPLRETPPAMPVAAPTPARGRFALIARAEAAELSPPRASARRPGVFADPIAVAQRASLPPRTVAAATGASGRIYVQAGAFSLRDNAQRVGSRIARLGSVQVTAASVNGVEMYRVRLGPFENALQADRLLARVVDSGYPAARIVND
jgi:rare lipoprotein A